MKFEDIRAVPYLRDYKKNNAMVFIKKNNNDEYNYVEICGQQDDVAKKIRHKLLDFQNGEIVVRAETPNSIIHYNWLEQHGLIIKNPDRVRHFRLGVNTTHEQLQELREF